VNSAACAISRGFCGSPEWRPIASADGDVGAGAVISSMAEAG